MEIGLQADGNGIQYRRLNVLLLSQAGTTRSLTPAGGAGLPGIVVERIIRNGIMERIGVLTSGGDAQGMNAAVRAVTRTALDQGGGSLCDL